MTDTQRRKYRIADIRQFTRDFLDPDEWEYANRDFVRFNENVECLYQYARSVDLEEKHLVAKLFFSSGDRAGIAHAGLTVEWESEAAERFLNYVSCPENYLWLQAVARQEQWELAVGWDPFRPQGREETVLDLSKLSLPQVKSAMEERGPSYYLRCPIDIEQFGESSVRGRTRRTLLYLIPICQIIRGSDAHANPII